MDEVKRLIEKYAGAGPRYTSYPTAVDFDSNPTWGIEWANILALEKEGLRPMKGGGQYPNETVKGYSLYFHLPFCHSLCYYCACNKIIPQNRNDVAPYIDALISEVKSVRALLGSKIPIEQIHWGGGTPNFLLPEEMKKLHLEVCACFDNILPDCEVSIEIDPRTTTPTHLRVLRELGFNRVSIGVQDFDPLVQQTVNRVQSFQSTAQVCKQVRDLGFSGLNIDLIYGLPNQTIEGFQSTLAACIDIHPDRLAVYGYAHVTWKEKVQKAMEKAAIPSPQDRIALFLEALRVLKDADYEYIGMDHFALPGDALNQAVISGRLNRNFMGYSTHAGARVLGFGVSAISSLPHAMVQNTKDIAEYLRTRENESFSCVRGLHKSFDDCIRADVIETILCSRLVNPSLFSNKWQVDFKAYFAKEMGELLRLRDDQLIKLNEDGSFQLTSLGRLFARNVAMTFDSYLQAHLLRKSNVFSQAV